LTVGLKKKFGNILDWHFLKKMYSRKESISPKQIGQKQKLGYLVQVENRINDDLGWMGFIRLVEVRLG